MARRQRSYQNPILPGFYPDPSVCRVGDDFYLVTSSFEYFPGIPIFHSRDLVHYRQIGHVLTRRSQLSLTNAGSSRGLFAPTIRHHRGRFYVVCTHVDAGDNFLVTAQRPEGPWSEPIFIDVGFDPSLFFDGDAVYYTRNAKSSDPDRPVILQAPIDLKTGKLERKPKQIFAGTGGIWPEGSHLYRYGDWYYLVVAEGGTSYDHSVVVARSRKATGPFESCPRNPVLTHRHRKRDPFQAIGHADLVDTQKRQTYAVVLGIRPKNGRFHHLGRETFLVPVAWSADGWPEFGDHGRVLGTGVAPDLPAHPFPKPRVRDDFVAPELDPRYVFVRNPAPRSYSLRARPSTLRLYGLAGSMADILPKAFIGRRQTDFNCRCRTRLEFEPVAMSDEAGLVVRNSEDHHYRLVVVRSSLTDPSAREAQLWAVVAGRERRVGRSPLGRGALILEISATESTYVFRAGTAGRVAEVGRLPTKALSSEAATQAGKGMCFTGVVFGMYAGGRGHRVGSPADFDWFEYRAL
jgi:xylan 1,4-beta-xylosidase